MSRIFITGSSTGLGLATAQSLLAGGHDVVLHARNAERAAALTAEVPQALAIVTGDLSLLSETRDLADAVNAIGGMDAVIHNAGLYGASGSGRTAEGHSVMTAVNLLAPYVLTACIDRPGRLVRDDGIVYHKYLSELTYLLFLKVASETGRDDFLPQEYRWDILFTQPAPGMLRYYRKMLTCLGEDADEEVVREIFKFPTTVFQHEENLRKVVDGINAIDWHEAVSDGLEAVYESLLQRNTSETRSGAGQ